jgi:hypothetical protein
MKYAINYSDNIYKLAQAYNTKTAYKRGKVDKVIEFSPNDISEEFKQANSFAFIENNPRIGKFGLWRPHIICETMKIMENGDYLIYSDSGAYYKRKVQFLIDFMEKKELELLLFENEFLERMMTKRDVFTYLELDMPAVTDSKQRISTFFLVKKTKRTILFFNEYLQLALEVPFLFTDEENKLGKENYADFIDHRHNQSVLSVLSKKYNIPAFRDPSQWGNGTGLVKVLKNIIKRIMHKDEYPTVFISHRSKSVTFITKIKTYYKNLFPRSFNSVRSKIKNRFMKSEK